MMFVRTVKMDEHSGELTRASFIDPMPFASPDMVYSRRDAAPRFRARALADVASRVR